MHDNPNAISPAPLRGRRTRLRLAVAGVALSVASVAFTLPANAAVHPRAGDARFIKLINKCGDGFKSRTFSYTAVGRIKGEGRQNTWKTWKGSINCHPLHKQGGAIFAWAPASHSSEVIIEIVLGGQMRRVVIDADTNYCLTIHPSGNVSEAANKVGGGGWGDCKA